MDSSPLIRKLTYLDSVDSFDPVKFYSHHLSTLSLALPVTDGGGLGEGYSPLSNGFVSAAGCVTVSRAANTSATMVSMYGIITAKSDESGIPKI